MTEKWLDYSGFRPDPNALRAAGITGVLRYLSEPNSSTAWKRITSWEKDRILASGLDLILNWEWYEGRMLEGYAAGAHDGAAARAQARALGYPRGASIYFSHDTSARNDSAVLAYMRAANTAMGGEYHADIYSGYDVVELCLRNGVARYGWQTLAWSYGRVGQANIYQNGNTWFNKNADENVILGKPLGSWRNHGSTPGPAPVLRPVPAPTGNGAKHLVTSGETLSAIATRYRTTVTQLVAWNPIIKNPNVIQVGWALVVSKPKPKPKPAPKPKPSPAPAGKPNPKPKPKPAPKPTPTPTHTYKVVRGDNLTLIAQKYHTTVKELVRLNPVLAKNPNLLNAGQVIKVPGAAPVVKKKVAAVAPPKVRCYRVVSGDSLGRIAARYGTTVRQLVAWNSHLIKNPDLIHVGWVLRVG